MKKIIPLFCFIIIVYSCHDKLVDNEQQKKSKTRSTSSSGSLKIGFNSSLDNSLNLDLGKEGTFEIRAKATPPEGYEVNYFNFYMQPLIGSMKYGEYWPFGTNIQNEFDSYGNYSESFVIYRGGDFKIYGEIVFKEIGNTSNVTNAIKSNLVTLHVAYPDRDEIEKQAMKYMQTQWEKSIASNNLNARREFGFYILGYNEDGTGMVMEEGKICEGKPNDCPTKGKLTYTVDIEYEDEFCFLEFHPLNDTKYIVGIFHTHPPLTNCPSGAIRDGGVGPSESDRNSIGSPHVPGFVYDYVNNIKGGHAPDAVAKVYPYGPYKRVDSYEDDDCD